MIYSNPLDKRVKDFSKRIAIKDGEFKFSVHDNFIRVNLDVLREDNFCSGKQVRVHLTRVIPVSFQNEDPTQVLALTCWSMAKDFAYHEIAEQFYIDGRLPYDPHRIERD